MNKKTIKDIDLKNKKVLVRCDFNVPMDEEKNITDLSTIKSNVKDNLREYIFQKTKRNPMILPIIMEI